MTPPFDDSLPTVAELAGELRAIHAISNYPGPTTEVRLRVEDGGDWRLEEYDRTAWEMPSYPPDGPWFEGFATIPTDGTPIDADAVARDLISQVQDHFRIYTSR